MELEKIGYGSFREMNAERKANVFKQVMTETNDRILGRMREGGRKSVWWWSEELSTLKKEVRKLRRKYQNTRKHETRDDKATKREYAERLRTYKKCIRETKENKWREYVRENANNDPWGEVYKVCMGKKRKIKVNSIKDGDRMTEGWKKSVEVLMNAFFSGSNRSPRAEELPEGEPPGDGPGKNETEKWDKEMEYEEVESALRRMSVGKSPGLDGITTEMLRAVWRYASGYVKELLVTCVREGKIPAEWKKANVVILLKSPDRVKSYAGSYRPISLVSA